MRRFLFLLVSMAAATVLADDYQVTFGVTGGQGYHGQTMASKAFISTDTELQGWSFGIRWEAGLVGLVSHARGLALETVNHGNPADFISIESNPVDGPGITQGVVVSFMQTAVLPVGQNYEVLSMVFSLEGKPVGDEPIVTRARFTEDLGLPPVAVVYVVGGNSYAPNKADATLTILPPPKDCKIENFTCESDPDNVFLKWDYLGCGGERPFDFLYLYRDRTLLGELSVDTVSYDDLGLQPGVYTYTLAWVYWPASGDPITLDYVQCTAQVIALMVTDVSPKTAFLPGTVPDPAQAGNFLPGVLTVQGRGFRGGLNDENEPLTQVFIGGVPAPTLAVVGDHTITASIPCSSKLGVFDVLVAVEGRGEILVPKAFTYGWLRADVDIDGSITLQDAIVLLNYLFLEGREPYCLDAADANDDGVNDVADAVFLIYMAAGINPSLYTPKEPWTAPAVTDPTGVPLGCALVGFTCTQGR